MEKDPVCTGPDRNEPASEALARNGRTDSVRRRRLWKRLVWPVFKTVASVVFSIAVAALILIGLEGLAKRSLSRSSLGSVYPDSIQMARRDFTRPVSHYDYDFVPGVCLEYNTAKGNRYEYANNAGFRDPRDISVEKPDDEIRVFLMGGSTAFGLGAVGEAAPAMGYYSLPYQETIGHMMEMILNSTLAIPGKKVRVYNTAVWGYAYQHHLMRYMTKLRRYNPDLIISLDGANEIPAICKLTDDWDYFREGQFNGILQEIYAYNRPGLASYLTLWLKNNTYLMTLIWGGRDVLTNLRPEAPMEDLAGSSAVSTVKRSKLASADPGDAGKSLDAELARKSRLADRNVATVVRVVENFHSMLENDGVPHLFALQPWLYLSKKRLSEQEKTLVSLAGAKTYYGVPSDKMYGLLVNRLVDSARERGYFLVDFSTYFDDVSEWVFTDWCHLTAGANYIIAKELANLVKEHLFGQPLAQGESVQHKDGLFWDLAASATVLSAPRPDSPENGPRNMLTGYPSAAMYSSAPFGDEPGEVVLDLMQTHPVSRTRLVWADESSVPEKWTIDVSEDGTTWKTLVAAGKDQLDSYSLWPGFEYYAAEPTMGRYVRFRAEGGRNAPIRLRSWNIFR